MVRSSRSSRLGSRSPSIARTPYPIAAAGLQTASCRARWGRVAPMNDGWRIERDSLGLVQVPAERYWGAQTQRAIEHFPIGADRFRWGRPVIRAPRHPQAGRGAGQRGARPAPARRRRAHRPSRPGGRGRRSRRRVPTLGVPDRLGHADQHERQRGDRQPRQRAGRLGARSEQPDPPERLRQPRPVEQRRLPRGHAHRRGGAGGGLTPARRCGPPRHARRQGRCLPGRRDAGAHPPAGRDARDARSGDGRMGRAARSGAQRRPRHAAGPARAGARRDRRRHRSQHASALRRNWRRDRSRSSRASHSAPLPTSSLPSLRTTPSSTRAPPSGLWPALS